MSVRLPDHLDLIATAPGGIQKLRGLILELAVRGKLVAQGTNENLEDWRLGSFSDFFSLEYGDNLPAPKRSETGEYPVYGSNGVVGTHSECIVTAPCIVVGRKGSAGALNLCRETGCWVTDVAYYCVPPTGVDLDFAFTLFHTLELEQLGKGIKPGLSRKEAYLIPVAIPPLPEQRRIVAKVDELMVLCEQMEAEQTDSARAHTRLVDTLLATLTQSTDAADLATNWQRLAEHFDTLFTTEPSLDALKQTILQLAVMGKLVPQNPNDEPASELLKRIAKERAQLEADGVCKKSKPLPPVGDDEQQHSIPRTWKYVRLQEICSTITDGTHQTPKYTESGRPFLSAQNVKPFRFMPEFFRYVSEKDYQGYVKSSKPEFGDILLTRVGAMIGEAAVIDKQMDFAIYVSLALLKPCQPFVLPEFITLWLNSPFGTHSSIRDTLGRGVSAGNLNLSMIRAFAVPLPPISEQKRIVGKVGELMLLCDRLKIDFVAARQHQATLADSLIDSALEAT